MPRYIAFLNYTSEAVKTMIENPSDRVRAAGEAARSLGGDLVSFDWIMGGGPGSPDALVVVDMPDRQAAKALQIRVQSSGAFTHVNVCGLLRPEEMAAVWDKVQAVDYRPPTK